MGKIKGKDLLLFVKEGSTKKCIGYTTSHSLSISGNTTSIATVTKDDASGAWDEVVLDSKTWQISSDAVMTDDTNREGFVDLFDLFNSGTEVEVAFGWKTDAATCPTTGWVLNTSKQPYFEGKGYITSLDVNAEVSGVTTYSVTISGNGALERKTTGAGGGGVGA